MVKVALITGITGQDGSYLSELLLDKDYYVWGIIRRASDINTRRIDHLYKNKNLILKYGDLSDGFNIVSILSEIKEKYDLSTLEIYNLGAMSHVRVSFDIPEYTANIDGLGALRILEAVRCLRLQDKVKFYQASSSELYGKIQETPQTETTPFYPRSPYGVAKLYAYWIVKNYREAYNMFACNGILFNHESPRRGPTFITRKITRGLGMILSGERDTLCLGNIDAIRDWGHAKDYVYGMWLMLQSDTPDDYVLATNECHSVREFVEQAFTYAGFDIYWKGSGINEIGCDRNTDRVLITISEKYFRPAEVHKLIGNAQKAKNNLGWIPKVHFNELVKDMVMSDCPSLNG
tara:strand:- start:1098 stop:2141 length:1044 start_codon:yes stop_codon:yes gene_type:complete